jgi:hypothetical protein
VLSALRRSVFTAYLDTLAAIGRDFDILVAEGRYTGRQYDRRDRRDRNN